jgi:REP element-mobilizing transposase RayT
MPYRTEAPFREGIYYINFACYRWLRLIQFTNGYDLVYRWFEQLRSHNHRIAGFVIMPNQIQLLISFSATTKSINTIIGEGKRLIAYGIIERLKEKNEGILLSNLRNAVTDSDRRKGKKHEIWEESFDWKFCETLEYVQRKLDIMHSSPTIGATRLVKAPAEYEHSSARYYLQRKHALYPVVDAEFLVKTKYNNTPPLLVMPALR